MFQLVLTLLVNLIYANCATNPIVSTSYGPIQGLTGSYNLDDSNYDYEAFLGIPFAEPPLGNKRFQLPVKFNSTWTEPYQATKLGNGCMQLYDSSNNFNISEDCLYLNIWRPKIDYEDPSNQLLPVYYHLHGSGYIKSSGSIPDRQGDVLAATQKIIVVNSNYRLGAFGFAYGSFEDMPGNVGLYDALMVLKWVQDNIRSFGGDPDRVSLTGLSAGSKMVSIISSLPNTRKLYSRLIMMSGAATNQIHVESSVIATSKTRLLASKVNCLSEHDYLISSLDENLSIDTINCLKKLSADDLLKAQSSKDINEIGASEITVFLPVYGTKLIENPPMVNIANRLEDNKNVPILIGIEQDEASIFKSFEEISTIQDAYSFTKERVSYAMKNLTNDQFEVIFKLYFAEADPIDSFDIRSRCVNLCSDMNYRCPSLVLAEFYSQVNDNIFFYENVHSAEKLHRPYGTQHGDDTLFGLGAPYRKPESYTSADRQFSSILLKVYGDFTKGIPFTDWPTIKLDKNDPNSLQLIKRMSLTPKDVVYHDQHVCMEWSRLFNYQLPRGLERNYR